MKTRAPVWLVAMLLGLSRTTVFAQWGGGGMGGGRRGGGASDRSYGGATSREASPEVNFNSSEQILGRLQGLKTDLQLTPQQEAVWMQFEDKVRAYIDDLVRQKIKEQPVPVNSSAAPMDGLLFLSALVDKERNRYTSLEEIEIQARNLNDVLKPDQKIVLNSRLPSIVVSEIGH